MNRFVRFITGAAVLFVAAVAGVVSFSHIYDLGLTHGQAGAAARLLPLSVDGLIVCSGLVLLHEARSGRPAIWQARLGLWSGIAATVTANVLYGARFGLLGAALSGWPAYAFIIAAETMMVQVRRYGTDTHAMAGDVIPDAAPEAAETVAPAAPAEDTADEPDNVPETADAVPEVIAPEVATTVQEAAKVAYIASIRGGNKLSERALADRFGLPRSQVKKLRAEVEVASNGGDHDGADASRGYAAAGV